MIRSSSRISRALSVASLAGALCLIGLVAHPSAQGAAGGHWVGTWATAVVARPPADAAPGRSRFGAPPQCLLGPPAPPAAAAAPARGGRAGRGANGRGAGRGRGRGRGLAAPLGINDQTLREIVHVSLGGTRVRVVLSNAFGTTPLAVGEAHVARRATDAATLPDTDRVLTFNGSQSIRIPPGSAVVSDPVALTVPALADVAVDLYLPGDHAADTVTMHQGAQQTSYVSPAGNHAGATDMPAETTTQSWFYLARVEVEAPSASAAVVAFGDSITDGTRSTPDTNSRWPDYLARRLGAAGLSVAVLNEGIAGNRVLADGAGVSALARFDRDVLAQPGARSVIVLESINDIGIGGDNPCPSVADLIAGQQQLIERAHARGLKVFGATLTPFDGAGYWSPAGEDKRQALNTWIRTSGAYDGVVDFDAAVRDPENPTKLRPEYNPGDNLHMTDSGYEAMAGAIDLALFEAQ